MKNVHVAPQNLVAFLVALLHNLVLISVPCPAYWMPPKGSSCPIILQVSFAAISFPTKVATLMALCSTIMASVAHFSAEHLFVHQPGPSSHSHRLSSWRPSDLYQVPAHRWCYWPSRSSLYFQGISQYLSMSPCARCRLPHFACQKINIVIMVLVCVL